MDFSYSFLLFFTLILLRLSPISAKNGGNITVGQSLLATNNGSSWLSNSGDFAFGFHKVPNNTNMFLLAIWYAKIPDTIVWFANDGNVVPHGSSVVITSDGLVLNDPQGISLWNTAEMSSVVGAVSYGFMNDTGNFVLKSSATEDAIWQSFNYPTDTLLPTQIIKVGGMLVSRRTETNFTKGRFQLLLQQDGDLVLSTRDIATGFAYSPYYLSWTVDTTKTHPENVADKVVYSESGDFYIHIKNGSRFYPMEAPKSFSAQKNYQRITLNFDGVMTWYYHPRSSAGSNVSWSTIQSIPDNICMQTAQFDGNLDSGACGYNSICSIGEDHRPQCSCPPSYSLVDPNDTYGSCKQDFKLDVCNEQGQNAVKQEYKLLQLQNTDWKWSDYVKIQPSSEEDCKSSCLNDCFCAAATFADQSCWKKRMPLSNGRQDEQVTATTWIKVGNANNSNIPANDSKNPPHTIISYEKKTYNRNHLVTALLGGCAGVIFLLLSAIVFGIFMYIRKYSISIHEQNKLQIVKPHSEYSSVHCFSYKELEEATEGFKEEVGHGAFGRVYKGQIISGAQPIIVAVKKLHQLSRDADKEFKTEVNVIAQTHHKNLVQFLGFCEDEDQRLLVYEYMSYGTVADYLFSNLKPGWTERIKIAQGIAQGLLYLHEECSRPIIHCDIKPQNILLDDYQNARISDFGLAKLLNLNETHTNTAIRGTRGYVAPEWFRNTPITLKVDVYSFGVLLLEILCCRKSVYMELFEEEVERAILTDWAYDCYQSNKLEYLVNGDVEALSDMERLKKLVEVALWCIQEDPSLRPTMRTITQMLAGFAEVPNDPPFPTSFSITIQH